MEFKLCGCVFFYVYENFFVLKLVDVGNII